MASENWQLSVEAANLYEKYVQPIMVPWVDTLLETAVVKEGERVLDVACGTGFVARQAATYVGKTGQVTGIDLNEGMLTAARRYADVTTAIPIVWQEADVTSLPFEDGTFDVILCQQGMQFFPDVPAAVAELYRVLLPGGRLLFTIWAPIEENPYLDAIAKALQRRVGEPAANGFRGVSAKSFAFDFEPSLREFGFKQLAVKSPILSFQLPPLADQLPGYLASLPMADAISALPGEEKVAFLSDVSASLQVFTHDAGLELPSRSEVASAVK